MDESDADVKMLRYYKGLINSSFDSMDNNKYSVLLHKGSAEASGEKPLKTPDLNKSFTASFSPMMFIDSPIREKKSPQAYKHSVLKDEDSVDLRSINDSSAYKFAFQYLTEDDKDNNNNNDTIKNNKPLDLGPNSNIISLDEVPFIKNISMSEQDFENEDLDAKEKPRRLKKKSSMSRLARSNTLFRNTHSRDNSTGTSITEAPVKPKLKSARSLPQIRRLNSVASRKKQRSPTISTPTNGTFPKPDVHDRYNSNNYSNNSSYFTENNVFENAFTGTSIYDFQVSNPSFADNNHRKSYSNSQTDFLHRTGSDASMFDKLKTGLKKFSPLTSPRAQHFQNSIDENLEDIPTLSFRSKSLVKKASMGNINRNKSLKERRTSRDMKTEHKPKHQPNLSISTDKNIDTTDLESESMNNEPTVTSPVIKVNALNSRLSGVHFATVTNEFTTKLVDTSDESSLFSQNDSSFSRERSSSTTTGTLSIESNESSVKLEIRKTKLLKEVAKYIEQRDLEISAFDTTLRRLEESGWYSESNIQDIRKRKELILKNWNAKIQDLQNKYSETETMVKSEKHAESSHSTLKLAKKSNLFENLIDPLERFVFEN